jgi:glycerophosphoryl diester phosphodiesterase
MYTYHQKNLRRFLAGLCAVTAAAVLLTSCASSGGKTAASKSASKTSSASGGSLGWFASAGRKTAGTVKYIAHRGRDCDAPENTLPAYELAGKLGFWGAETDIQVTSDGAWVIMHDDTVDRMTNGTGQVASFTLDNIRRLVIDAGKNVSSYPGTKVPTFEEYLDMCAKYNVLPVTEIKKSSYTTQNYDDLAAIIKKHSLESGMTLISFDYYSLKQMRTRLPKTEVGYLGDISAENVKMAARLGYSFMDSDCRNVTQKLVEYCHAAGLPCAVWTVTDAAEAAKYAGWGVDAVTCENISPEGK